MSADSTLNSAIDNEYEEMQLLNPDNINALQIPDLLPNHTHVNMSTWSAGLRVRRRTPQLPRGQPLAPRLPLLTSIMGTATAERLICGAVALQA